MGDALELFGVLPWYAWIAIVAIVAGATRAIVQANHRHQQRMEMIRQGIDPRLPPQLAEGEDEGEGEDERDR